MATDKGAPPRGVEHPQVIDLISPRGDEVELLMIERRSWNAAEEQSQQLEEKFNNYLDYVLDGHLGSQYPQYQGVPAVLCLECPTAPEGLFEDMLEAMRRYATSVGIRFEIRVTPAEAGST